MDRVLLVEDSKTFGSLIRRALGGEGGYEVDWAMSYAEAEAMLDAANEPYVVGLLDVNLPDAPKGEVVDLVAARGLPCVIFTGELDSDTREAMWTKGVVDYILKEGMYSLRYIRQLIDRLARNHLVKVLVVDDSTTSRRAMAVLLRRRRHTVLEAKNGEEALKIMAAEPGVKLVLTDYYMPIMDGLDLLREIRRRHPLEEVVVIGLSGQGDASTSAAFIKHGANDFLNKPFIAEELYCRVMQNLQLIEHIEEVRKLSERDHLTGLYNRRYFFAAAQRLFANRKRKGLNLSLAMLDIDHFKSVNDAFGHEGGDEALKVFSALLSEHFGKRHVKARVGGEEFAVACTEAGAQELLDSFEALRRKVERLNIPHKTGDIAFTISIGLCLELKESLQEMVRIADENLYASKHSGRNRITFSGARLGLSLAPAVD
ncbi:MAG: diguanylate cyclase [Desulfovibrionaceae bacterium]